MAQIPKLIVRKMAKPEAQLAHVLECVFL